MITIPRLFYTKVSKDISHLQKSGFQTVGYSKEFIDKKDLLDFETHIHFPGLHIFEEKESYFFANWQETPMLVWLHTRSLPEELDEFGREGMFMVQGFGIPPKIWENANNPFFLGKYLRKCLITSYKDLINAPGLSLKTGELAPLELPEDTFEYLDIRQNPDLLPLLEATLEQITASNPPGILVQGNAERVTEILSWIGAYVPPSLRSKFNFDAAFDSGKLFFSPFRFVGFSQNRPATGNPLIFNAVNFSFLTTDKKPQSNGNNLYFRWLSKKTLCPKPPELEQHYQLSRLLISQPALVSSDLSIDELFWEANQNYVANALLSDDPRIFNFFLQNPLNIKILETLPACKTITQKRIEKLLPTYFEPAYQPFKDYLQVYFQQSIFLQSFDWLALFSDFLLQNTPPYEVLRAVLKNFYTENVPVENYPTLKIFLVPEPLPESVKLVPSQLRNHWLLYLMEVHKIQRKKLLEIGFLDEDIVFGNKTVGKSFWEKIKSFFLGR